MEVKKENAPAENETVAGKKKTGTKNVVTTTKKTTKTTTKETTKKKTAKPKKEEIKEAPKKKTVTKSETKTTTKKAATAVKEKAVKEPIAEIKAENKKTKSKKENKINEDLKPFKILSYIGILWIIGLLVPDREDKSLKFHVGQGIILSIVELIFMLFLNFFKLLMYSIFREEVYYNTYPTGLYTIDLFGSVMVSLLKLALFAILAYYMYIGIKNVLDNKDEELPIIGEYSFYK